MDLNVKIHQTELSGLVQRFYWPDFHANRDIVYSHGLVGYARVRKKSVAPFLFFYAEF